nr:hypothetical protein [Tanacetum cinerariifolium]
AAEKVFSARFSDEPQNGFPSPDLSDSPPTVAMHPAAALYTTPPQPSSADTSTMHRHQPPL